jgi:hypothetical protein
MDFIGGRGFGINYLYQELPLRSAPVACISMKKIGDVVMTQ